MTPFEVYLVMQASSVKTGFLLVGGLTSACSLLVMSICAMDGAEESTWAACKRYCGAGVLGFLMGFIVPSTQTVAAMYVLPTVTSEKWQTEAADIYSLAKKALQESLTGNEE